MFEGALKSHFARFPSLFVVRCSVCVSRYVFREDRGFVSVVHVWRCVVGTSCAEQPVKLGNPS